MKRLLVLTSATGAGHDTHALATAAWCSRLYGTYVDVTVAHALEDSHAFYRGAVGFYNVVQRRAPWFHHAYYNVIELLDTLNHGSVGLGRAHIVRLFQQMKPDAVLSVHDCLNRGYFELARAVLGPKVQCATYCPEFEGGYGFSRNWVNPRGEFFFGRTDETAREAARRGAAQSFASGHWAPPLFYDPPAEDAARTLGDLKLDPKRFTLLLSTGGAGAQNHRSLPVRCLGFTDRMPALLRASSAVVARAGATTAGEALLCTCPVIFNGIGGMMPQELPTLRWFRSRDIAAAAYSAGGVREHVVRWLERPAEHAAVIQRLSRIRDATTPKSSLELLLGM